MDSWDNIFRAFFNIPRPPYVHFDEGHGQHFPGDVGSTDDHDDNIGESSDQFGQPGGFFVVELDDMFDHIEQMFSGKFGDLGLTELPHIGVGSSFPNQSTSPRDYMLKDSQDIQHTDTLIAEPQQLQGRGFIFKDLWRTPHWGRIRPQNEMNQELDLDGPNDPNDLVTASKQKANVPYWRSSFQSMSVKTVQRPDGSVEHIKTVRDSDGKEETTVTRSLGDQSHSVTTLKTKDGEEKTESYTNLDEKELSRFNSLWSKGPASNDRALTTGKLPRLEERDEETMSIFKKLFGYSFPRFKKT